MTNCGPAALSACRYEAGFFPLDLQVRPAGEPADAPFRPLAALLRSWNKPVGPPGFSAAAAAAAAPVEDAPDEPAAPAVPVVAEPLPVQLPEAEDLLAGSFQQLELQPAAALGPSSADPVVDPALIRGSQSGSLLHQHQQQQAPVMPLLPMSGPLAQLPNVLLSAHVGAYAAECRVDMELQAVDNCLKALGVAA